MMRFLRELQGGRARQRKDAGMGRRVVRNRRSRRGGAMLELALLLPIYMLVFYAVWTAGDIGQVSTQAHLGARFAAWRRAPDTASSVANTIGGGTIRAQALFGTPRGIKGYARQPGRAGYQSVSLQYWEQAMAEEAFSYHAYALAPPLAWTGRAVPGSLVSDKEADADAAIKKHADNFVSPSGVDTVFPVDAGSADAFKYSPKMLAAAMEGDYGYGEKIPWLQRRVAMTGITMRGVAGITARNLYRSTHTVVLGTRYFTLVPNYYDKVGVGDSLAGVEDKMLRDYYDVVAPTGRARMQRNTLRNPSALRDELRDNRLTEGGRLHQLHFIGARGDLKPPF